MLFSKTILVVEDEFLVVVELADLLEEQGAVVEAFANWEDVRKWLERATPAAAILDYSLGTDTCEPVAELLAERGVPFIVHSGLTRDQISFPLLEGVHWLTKPTSPDDMMTALRTVLAGQAPPPIPDLPA